MLQKLQKRYGPRGLRVIGFPCNDFGAEEPDSLETIKDFCSREYGVAYELMDKVTIRERQGKKGRPIHPLYQWLTSQGNDAGPVSWNFEKFLIDREGGFAGRWEPNISPDHPAVIRGVEAALG